MGREIMAYKIIHGDTVNNSKTRLYNIWVNMRQRCNNKNYPQFKYWGGKGISVCKEWEDFKTFKKWALDNGYDDNLSIDRINGELGYSPENCRWSTTIQQARNQKSNHNITINNETKTLSEWLEISPITACTYHRRKRNGMTDKEALFTENRSNNHILKSVNRGRE